MLGSQIWFVRKREGELRHALHGRSGLAQRHAFSTLQGERASEEDRPGATLACQRLHTPTHFSHTACPRRPCAGHLHMRTFPATAGAAAM